MEHLHQKINITTIFRIAHVQYKKYKGEILVNSVMAPIWDRIKNICAGRFFGWTYEGKTQFIIMNHGFTLPQPREKQYAVQSGRVFLSMGT